MLCNKHPLLARGTLVLETSEACLYHFQNSFIILSVQSYSSEHKLRLFSYKILCIYWQNFSFAVKWCKEPEILFKFAVNILTAKQLCSSVQIDEMISCKAENLNFAKGVNLPGCLKVETACFDLAAHLFPGELKEMAVRYCAQSGHDGGSVGQGKRSLSRPFCASRAIMQTHGTTVSVFWFGILRIFITRLKLRGLSSYLIHTVVRVKLLLNNDVTLKYICFLLIECFQIRPLKTPIILAIGKSMHNFFQIIST